MRTNTTKLLCIFLISFSVFALAADPASVRVSRFAEVQITLDENFTLADAEKLTLAPDSEIELVQDSEKIKVQVPTKVVKQLLTDSVDVEISRNFILVQPCGEDNESGGDIVTSSSCSGYNQYGRNDDDEVVYESGVWYYSYIDLSFMPTSYIVNCVDVHYVFEPSWSFIEIDLTNQDASIEYPLKDYFWATETIDDYEFGITDFNGEQVSQAWVLWVYEYTASGSAYIDYWWIKVYYDDPGPYCPAGGVCDEYISRVQVGTIDKSSSCSTGYSDYAYLSTDMQIGTSYPITVTNGSPYTSDECGIWVDWNQDNDFDDPDEEISVSGGPASFFANITPPSGALAGSARMRIRILYDDTPTPCGFTEFGEVEDYTVNVTEAGQDYITISGYVRTESSDPLEGIDVQAGTGLNDTTNESGYYEIEVENPYSGIVFVSTPPVLWEFSSPHIFNNLTVDAPNTNFTATAIGPTYGGGSGTAQDPYLIFTEEHLQTLGATPQHWDKYFKLMADLDLSGYTGEEFNIIGDCSQGTFTGSFDGNEHFIYNFNYETTDNNSIGLFGCATACFITDLAIVDPVIKADNADSVGALVGTAQTVTIERCSIEGGSIEGENTKGVGGIFGRGNTVFLYDSYATAYVKAADEYGGLGGELIGGLIHRCYMAGQVETTNCCPIYREALIGSGQLFAVADCYWDVEVCSTTGGSGYGRTTDQMYQQDTFENWDFENTWRICENANYPTQAWKEFAMGDLNCSYEIDTYDLGFMCTQWLMNKVYFDIAPDGGDSFVDFLDWSTFAAAWQSSEGQQNYDIRCDVEPDGGDGKIDEGDLLVFIDEWLANGYSHLWADIYPQPDGDGVVNIYDFALFAQLWMNNQ